MNSGRISVQSLNEKRLARQLLLLIIFCSILSFILVNQYPRQLAYEKEARRNISRGLPYYTFRDSPYYDPWKDEPFNFNPYDEKMTIIESYIILLCILYIMFRLVNIFRVFIEDEQEMQWEYFWDLCENQVFSGLKKS